MNLKPILRGCFAKKANYQKLLYDRYYDYAFRIAFRYIYQFEQVANLVNAGFVEFFLNIALLVNKDERDLERVVTNSIKKIIITKAIDELLGDNLTQDMEYIHNNIRVVPLYRQHQEAIMYEELISNLRSLPPLHRVLFNMHVIDGFAPREIADRFGISIDTFESNLSQAKTSLQKLIKEKMSYTNTGQALPIVS